MHNNASPQHVRSQVACAASWIPPQHHRGCLIIFDYEDPTNRWLDPRMSPFSGTELHAFRTVPASQRLASATRSARAASSTIRAGGATLFATARDELSSANEADSLGQLVATAIMGVADTPACTLIVAPGRWRHYLEACGLATDMPVSPIPGSADLWLPEFDSGLRSTSPVIWRGASETETIEDVRALLAGSLLSKLSIKQAH